MSLDVVQVDAFTDRAFTGNPAAVFILNGIELPHHWQMQEIAREMNLSESAFATPHDDGFDLRWFTPSMEVDLCGHATLATAHVLWQDGHLAPEAPARFHTRSGLLTARRNGEWIQLDFPADPVAVIDPPDHLERALGSSVVRTGKARFDLLAELSSEKAVRTLRPNHALLASLDARGVIVTSPSIGEHFDFVSRYFAPRVGVPEDPVTGSAHCALACYWAERFGRDDLIGYQVSERGGTVRVGVRPNERVFLGGKAITVMRGRMIF